MLWRRRSGGVVPMAVLAALVALAGCGGANADREAPPRQGTQAVPQGQEDQVSDTVAPSHCPPGLPSCRAAEGRIAYVERVDPDGDGDAHFVIVDLPGITLLGLTAIDVRKGLRPQPLPGVGELISAAGPVQTGSHGQSQIHALELHVANR